MNSIINSGLSVAQKSRAYGAILGAYVGDALGSFIEFKQIITYDDLKEALQMPGGGPHCTGAGQVTDDSELATSLMKGLIDGQG